jgi:hypothetical protein
MAAVISHHAPVRRKGKGASAMPTNLRTPVEASYHGSPITALDLIQVRKAARGVIARARWQNPESRGDRRLEIPGSRLRRAPE